MIKIQGHTIFLMTAFALVTACNEPAAPEEVSPASLTIEPQAKQATSSAPKTTHETKKSAASGSAYSIAEQSQVEVRDGLKNACLKGKEKSQPFLLEFSAPWCGDCRRLAEMKQEPALKAKLAETPHFVINVGRFDRHEALLKDFNIRAIASWQVVGTDSCEAPVSEWKKIAGRTLEPRTGKTKVTSDDLLGWLEGYFKPS